MLTPDQARAVAEKLRLAQEALTEAVTLSERPDVKLACQIGAMRDRLATLEAKARAKIEQKPPTLRQFARQHRL